MENKLASLLVLSLGKALNGMPPSFGGKQVVGSSSLPVVVAQSEERYATRACAHKHEWMNEYKAIFTFTPNKNLFLHLINNGNNSNN